MRYLLIIILALFSLKSAQSQINELGLFVGANNFIGDVGATNYINPNQLAIGGIYKWNRSKRHSYRFSLTYAQLEGDDAKSHESGRQQRGYTFDNSILELSAGIEFTFWEYDLHDGNRGSTPYIYLGVSTARYDNIYFANRIMLTDNKKHWAFGIPVGLGYKQSITDNIVLGAEMSARYTFSDGIDGSYSKEGLLKQFAFGNINNNDWYVFTGITLTYTFGINPCFCVFNGEEKVKKRKK